MICSKESFGMLIEAKVLQALSLPQVNAVLAVALNAKYQHSQMGKSVVQRVAVYSHTWTTAALIVGLMLFSRQFTFDYFIYLLFIQFCLQYF